MNPSPWKKRILVLTLAHVVGTLHMVSVMAMAPVIQQDLALSVTEVGLLVTGYYGAQTAGAVPAGLIADRAGVGLALLVGQVVLVAGALLFAGANGFDAALAATLLMGFGYSMNNPSTARGVLDWFPVQRRATAMGVKQTGVPIGGVLAAANGALVAYVDWRDLMTAVAAVTLAYGLVCLIVAEPPAPGISAHSRRGRRSLWPIFRRRSVLALFAASVPWNMGQTNFFAYLTLFLREVAMSSQQAAGACLALAQGASVVGRLGWGVISDRVFGGRRKTLLVALCASAAALLAVLALVGAGAWIYLAFVLAPLLGLTIASFAALVQNLASETVPREESGAAVGISLMGTSLGGMIGPTLYGLIVDTTGSYPLAWLATAVLVAAGTLLVGLAVREDRP